MSNSDEFVASEGINTILYIADQENRLYEWSSEKKASVKGFKIPDIEPGDKVKMLTFNPNNL
jgi:hypothetical protein